MIEIVSDPDYFENMGRHRDCYPCIICGRRCPKPKYMVRLIYGTHVGTPEEAEAEPAADMGYYPIGSDCLKKHPEIQPFAVKT